MSKRKYHHGDLKAALIDAALGLIRETGINGFSFAEAARRAGVSAAAPYRHFKDRDELLAETARIGYEKFAIALNDAWDEGQPSHLVAFDALGAAFLTFARTHSDYYRVMFDPTIIVKATPELKAMSDRAFDVLLHACGVLSERAPKKTRPPASMMAYHIWAFSHGVASLHGTSDSPRAPISADEMLETGIGVYLQGLGLIET